ncbi:MAG TPA: DnaJ domain-containing protein [Anaerolineae bacterium]|nr:DnaJ domain-containing protein [Anaerolineae bacterium]
MEFDRDYYAILGVPSDADERTIKQAYRQLARRYHPDVSEEEEAAEWFQEIQQAYEILTEPMQREAFDHWRRQRGMRGTSPLLLRVTPSQAVLPSLGESQLLYVMVELSASDQVESQRLPLNLCLVLDRSTSMKGGRLQQVKEAARYIVDRMEPQDVLSLVVFSDRASLVLPGQRNIDRAVARKAINSIQSGGGTEIYQGLELGLEQVEQWHSDEIVSHLILLTDGQTYGDEEQCINVAKLAGKQNISFTLMGIGSDWNDKLLDEMAKLSGRPEASVYIDSTSKIAQAFHERIHGLGNIFAYNVNMAIHTARQITLKEVFRVSPQINRLTVTDGQVTLGSLEKERPQAVMLELVVPSLSPGTHRVLQLDIESKIPAVGDQTVRLQHAMKMAFNVELSGRTPVPPDIVSAMGKLAIFKMQERVMQDIEQGDIEPAVTRLKTMATRLLDIGEVELARAALLEAGRLSQTGNLSAAGRKKIRYGTRELTIVPKEVSYD